MGKKELNYNPSYYGLTFWGEDNRYYYRQRLAWITKTLHRRYGDTMKAGEIKAECLLTANQWESFRKVSNLDSVRVCTGRFPTDEVARAVVDWL